jgi:protein-tyrosine phosphatase
MSPDPTRIDIAVDPQRQRMVGVSAHGLQPFDVPFISEIVPDLWLGGCEDDLVLPDFIAHLVSLYPWERYTVNHELDSALEVRMFDSIDQAFHQVDSIATWVNACRESGPTLVHCQAGLNRSSLVVGRALMLDGMAADEAIALIRRKRSPACLSNPSFERWLRSLPAGSPSTPHPSWKGSVMDELPDVGEIQEMVAAVEAKRADVTSAQQFDIDHQVLLNVRGEITEMLARELPAEYDKDDLRALLERIENAITRNRTQRAEATRSAEN